MKASPFKPVKLICGIITASEDAFSRGEGELVSLYGPLDDISPAFPFTFTDYYEREMGKDLFRKFVSFSRLIEPEDLSDIKIRSNRMEEEISTQFSSRGRIVNIDPGFCTAAALIMATTKDFAHRVPLRDGIYAHLELLFGKKAVKLLPWTYPDFDQDGYRDFFLAVRQRYLEQIRAGLAV